MSVIIDALATESAATYHDWEYYLGNYARNSGAACANSVPRYGGGGMNSWGQTCGVVVGASCVIELAYGGTQGGLFTNFYNYYEQVPQPVSEANGGCGNVEWFRTSGSRTTPKTTAAVINPVAMGSLLCHNTYRTFRTRACYTTDLGLNAADARTEFCARLVADGCYRVLRLINNLKKATSAPPALTSSTVPGTCLTSGCHSGEMPGVDNCFQCHK